MQSFINTTEKSASKVDAFIGACLMSSTYIHSAHFATPSYSQHKAFEQFYEEMPDLIDKFVEVHYGITGSYKPVLKTESNFDAVAYIRSIAETGTEIYDSVDSCLQSIIDEIKVLCYQTIYRLTHLS